MSKPSIAELLIASGHTDFNSPLLQQAIQTLYGDVGANLDERDWSAIMATNNPMAVAEQALKDQWQDAAYLLRNADHLIGQGYSPVSVEFTYRQMAERLDFAYDASWSAGTQYAWLGALSDQELAARVAFEAEVPRIAFEFTDTAANLDVSHAGTLSFSVAGASQSVNAGDVPLTPGATLREGFVTLTRDSGAATTTADYVVVGTNVAMDRHFGLESTIADRLIILGSASDRISAGDSNDTVYGGEGADTMTGGAGVDTFVQAANSSVIATAEGVAVDTAIAAGDTFTFGGGVDVITDFTAGVGGEILDLQSAGALTTMIGQVNWFLFGGVSIGFLSGSFNSVTGAFTTAANGIGADTLILDVSNQANNDWTSQQWVVLIGVDSDNLVAGNFV